MSGTSAWGTIKAQMDAQGDEFDHPYEQGDLTPCTPTW